MGGGVKVADPLSLSREGIPFINQHRSGAGFYLVTPSWEGELGGWAGGRSWTSLVIWAPIIKVASNTNTTMNVTSGRLALKALIRNLK